MAETEKGMFSDSKMKACIANFSFIIKTNFIQMSSDAATIAAARAEALTTAREAFQKLDLNGDGNVDKDELRQIALQAELGIGNVDAAEREAKIADFFQTFDANGDGKVQLSEWEAFFGNLFDTVV